MTTIGRFSMYVIETRVDETGLRIWSWILVGSNEKQIRTMIAYQPCTPARTSKGGTVFEQHPRFFEQRADFCSPITIFYKHLVSQIILWQARNKEIVLYGDFNEHVYTRRIAKLLAKGDLLIQEQCQFSTKEQLPATFLYRPRLTDRVFTTPGIFVRNTIFLRRRSGVGDH